MTRIQILLEEAQHRWLTDYARRRHKSLSKVLRGLIDAQRMASRRDRKSDPLFKLIGAGRDHAHDVAEQHDTYLYG